MSREGRKYTWAFLCVVTAAAIIVGCSLMGCRTRRPPWPDDPRLQDQDHWDNPEEDFLR